MSPSTSFTSIAIAGGLSRGPIGASLGRFFAEAFVKEGANVKILGRTESIGSDVAKELAALGVAVVEVDYNSPSSLASALEGVEVVVSTLAGGGFVAQIPLTIAAKQAGLVGSREFGPPLTTVKEDSPLWSRALLFKDLEKIGVPLLRVSVGVFPDFSLSLNVNANNEIEIVGKGEVDISFTSRHDVAAFVAHIVTHLPRSTLTTLSSIAIEGSSASLLSLASILLAQHPSAKVVHVSYEEALRRFKEEGDFLSFIKMVWDQGGARSYEKREDLRNDLWEEWNPKRVEEFLKEEAGGGGGKLEKVEFGADDF